MIIFTPQIKHRLVFSFISCERALIFVMHAPVHALMMTVYIRGVKLIFTVSHISIMAAS